MFLAILAAALPLAAPAAETVRSPDGRIAAQVTLDGGLPYWEISYNGEPLLPRGALGLAVAGTPLQAPFVLEQVACREADDTWRPVWGNLSVVRDRYAEQVLTLREERGAGRRFEIVLRCYPEGVALRYRVPAQPGWERVVVQGRRTEYAFGADRVVYHNRKYEYGTVTLAAMSRSEGNVTVALPGGRFVSLTDADRADFSRVSWGPARENPGVLVGTLAGPAEGTAPFATSWEVMIVGANAAQLYEHRHLVENVNPPAALADTAWIRAGEAISNVRNARMVTAELKRLVDFASANRIEYLEIDHSWCGAETKWTPEEIAFFERHASAFWADKPDWRRNVGGNPTAPARGWVPFRPKADTAGNYVDLDVAELAAYARAQPFPVGICLYVRGAVLREFGGEHAAADVFAVYRRWGVAGVKLGFVPSGTQVHERAVAEVVRLAAAARLIVNIHDGYYPSGLSRTYPNLMNIEGVAGDEAEPSMPLEIKSWHDVMLPFTRGLMGPFDYTPEMFKPAKTHAHQVAMLGVYHGRPSIRGGMKQWSPGGVGGGEIEFLRRLPGLFDELKVVTDLGKSVTVMRRHGGTWFVGSMADGHARSYPLPLDFLRPGVTYDATLYTDTPGSPATTRRQRRVDARDAVTIDMQPHGGHLLILDPVSPAPAR